MSHSVPKVIGSGLDKYPGSIETSIERFITVVSPDFISSLTIDVGSVGEPPLKMTKSLLTLRKYISVYGISNVLRF